MRGSEGSVVGAHVSVWDSGCAARYSAAVGHIAPCSCRLSP